MRKKAAGILKAVWTIVISVALISAGLMWVIVNITMDAHREKKKEKEETEEKQLICALTDENCIFVAERGTCTGCPIAEEAEKRGYR